MSGNIDNRLFGKKPFPLDTIFDSLRQFDPIKIIPMLKSNTSGPVLNQVDSLFSKVSYLLRQVNSLSWLYVVWKKNFFSTGKLSREDMSMTVILLRMHSHIDTGKRFNDRQDRKDEEVISTRSHDHSLGYTGFSLDDFKCVNRYVTSGVNFFRRWQPFQPHYPSIPLHNTGSYNHPRSDKLQRLHIHTRNIHTHCP